MNFFDDIKAAERRTTCTHLWIQRKDKTVYCYECGEEKKK